MKNFPGTFKLFLIIAVGFVSVLTFQVVAKEKGHRDAKPAFEVCITEPVVVSDIPAFKRMLKKVGKGFYKVRIQEPGKPDYEDGDLAEECTIGEKTMSATAPGPVPSGSPAGGGQVTQRLRLNAKQLREIAGAVEGTSTPTFTPTPKSSP